MNLLLTLLTPLFLLLPVGTHPTVLRPWDPPPTPYAKGHRGVDLAAEPGAEVRAVAAGRITFAGRVAGRGVLVLELHATGTPPLRTTYEPVRARVPAGTEVKAGEPMGELEKTGGHCEVSCLHWGLKRGETYLNPLPLLHRKGPPRLLPVLEVPRQPTARHGQGPAPRPRAGDPAPPASAPALR